MFSSSSKAKLSSHFTRNHNSHLPRYSSFINNKVISLGNKIIKMPRIIKIEIDQIRHTNKNCLKARLLEIQQWQPYKTHPSSFTTSRMVWIVDLYLIWPGTGWGPCIRLLATSVGILANEDKAPAVKPRSACFVMEILFYKAEINYFIAMTSC